MCRYNHGTAVDYFAVGVIAYELMLGKVRPTPNGIETLSRENAQRNQGTDVGTTSLREKE
jgi:hypothetical protein